MLIFAHRGASGYAPENTMAAFRLAYEQKADGIELDVHLTRDGQVVICHDDHLQRTSNGCGELRNFTLAELKQLDFGGWHSSEFAGEKIPAFAEFWQWFGTTRSNFIVNIEIKNGPYIHEGIEQKINEIINLNPVGNQFNRIIISSFHHNTLNKVKAVNPQFKTAPLFEATLMDIAGLCKQAGNSEYIHPCYCSIDRQLLIDARTAGIAINAWTVNSAEQLEYVKNMNLNGVISNYPDRARRILCK